MKKFLSLILICFISITFFGCGKSEQGYQDYIDMAIYNASNLLIQKGYNDITVSVEKSSKIGDTQFYNLLLTPDKDAEYAEILKILDILNTNTYFNASECDFKIFFFPEYYEHSSGRLSIVSEDKLGYSYALKDVHYNIVYNAIAEKNGIDLTLNDKGVIYLELDDMLTSTYPTGQHKYAEEYCYSYISSKYNISVECIKTEVYVYGVFEYIY